MFISSIISQWLFISSGCNGQDDVHVCNLRLNFQRTIGDNPGTARPRDRRSPNKNESGAAPSAEGAMSLHSQWTAASWAFESWSLESWVCKLFARHPPPGSSTHHFLLSGALLHSPDTHTHRKTSWVLNDKSSGGKVKNAVRKSEKCDSIVEQANICKYYFCGFV